MASHFGEMAAEYVRAAGDGVVGLVDCITAEYYCVAAYSCLRVDDGVAAYDGGVAVYTAGYVQASEEDEGAAGQVAFDLHGTEDADGIMHLLAGGDEDVLSEVDAVASRLSVGGGDEQKREAENPNCAS